MAATDAYVLDASVAIKWHLVDEAYATQALSLLQRFVNGEIDLLAPEHIRYEVPNAISVATRRTPARLSYRQAEAAIAQFLELPLTTFTDAALLTAAYELSARIGCASYDAVYLALAQRTQRPLVTADDRLYRQARALPMVLWLGAYE